MGSNGACSAHVNQTVGAAIAAPRVLPEAVVATFFYLVMMSLVHMCMYIVQARVLRS
jgi:hypothetical protein